MLLSPLTGVRDKLTPVGGDNVFTSHLFKLLVIIRGVAFLVDTASPELNLWSLLEYFNDLINNCCEVTVLTERPRRRSSSFGAQRDSEIECLDSAGHSCVETVVNILTACCR